ncbi:MAG TPA: multidrug effflux MFS transporter [Caulobacterales bacterium]|nr:multidrug effflux MFS transporter [Caulobacterales bacterium]
MAESSVETTIAPEPTLGVWIIVALGVLTALGPFAIDLYLPALPAIARDLHSDNGAAQRTVAIFFLGMALGQPVHGPLSDRFGRRLPLFGGLAVFTLSSIGCALAPSMEFLTAMRFLQALGGCAGVVVARAIVRDRFQPRDTVRVFATLTLILGVSPILAPLFGGYILLVSDWRTIFLLLAALGAVMLAATYFLLIESRSDETAALARSESPWRSYKALIANPHVMGFVLVGAFAGAAMPTYVSCAPSVLIGGYHVSPTMFGWYFGVNGAGLIAATQVNGYLSRSYRPDLILKIANRIALGVALIMLLNAFTGFGGMWGVVVPLFLMCVSMGFNQSNALAGAMAEDPLRAGATAALVGATQFAVGAVCSTIASAYLDGSARPMALMISATIAVAVILFAVMRPHTTHFGGRP